MQLESVVRTIASQYGSDDFGVDIANEIHTRNLDDPRLNDPTGILVRAFSDELLLLSYMTGLRQIRKAFGMARIRFLDDLTMLSFSEIGGKDEGKRTDDNLYRLIMRIEQRHSRGQGPSFASLVDRLGQSEQVLALFRRPVTHDDIIPVEVVLKEYLLGKRSIKTAGEEVTIVTADDLTLLAESSVISRHDERLYWLWRRVKNKSEKGKGRKWSDLIDAAGKSGSTRDYFGRNISYADTNGRWGERRDAELILQYLTGKRNIQTAGGTRLIENRDDLHLFWAYNRRRIFHTDRQIELLWKRAHRRHSRGTGKSMRELIDDVGRMTRVATYLHSRVTYRDVVVSALINNYVFTLEQYMLGAKALGNEKGEGYIHTFEDLHLLNPDRSAGSSTISIYHMVWRLTPESRLTYWDVLDRAGAMPQVQARYGRAITSNDVRRHKQIVIAAA